MTVFPINYWEKIGEERIRLINYYSRIQQLLEKYRDAKDPQEIQNIATELRKLRIKQRHLRNNLNIIMKGVIEKEEQKAKEKFEKENWERNSGYVNEFFTKNQTNYWPIINKKFQDLQQTYNELRQQRELLNIETDEEKKKQLINEINRLSELSVYRRNRFAALEYEATRRDEENYKKEYDRLKLLGQIGLYSILGEALTPIPEMPEAQPRKGFMQNVFGIRPRNKENDFMQTGLGIKPREKANENMDKDEESTPITLTNNNVENIEQDSTPKPLFNDNSEKKNENIEENGETRTIEREEKDEIFSEKRNMEIETIHVEEEPSKKGFMQKVFGFRPRDKSKDIIVSMGLGVRDENKDVMQTFFGPQWKNTEINLSHGKHIIESLEILYHKEYERFFVNFHDPNITHISFTQQLGYVLGFENENFVKNGEMAKYGCDLRGGISSFAVYTRGLTENMIMGNSLSSLLRVVSISGAKQGEYYEKIYDSPIFVRVLPKDVKEIEIELRTMDDGRFVPFAWGTVMIVLLFKKVFNI